MMAIMIKVPQPRFALGPGSYLHHGILREDSRRALCRNADTPPSNSSSKKHGGHASAHHFLQVHTVVRAETDESHRGTAHETFISLCLFFVLRNALMFQKRCRHFCAAQDNASSTMSLRQAFTALRAGSTSRANVDLGLISNPIYLRQSKFDHEVVKPYSVRERPAGSSWFRRTKSLTG